MPIVVDMSVAAKWVLRNETAQNADEILAEVSRDGALVPSIFPFEIENILFVAERRRRIDPQDVAEAIDLLKSIDLAIDPISMRSLGRFREIARDGRLSPYDASYLELAQRVRTRLITADERLATAARDRSVATVLVA